MVTFGEVVWNLGYELGSGDINCGQDIGFSFQHSVTKLTNGNILTFDNGNLSREFLNQDIKTSRSIEIDVTETDSGCEAELAWEYILPDTMLTLSRGECDRLPSGNALISAGRTGNVIEVNNEKEIVWNLNVKEGSAFLNNQSVSIFRSERVPNLFPGVFSFEVDNLQGELGSYYLVNK